MITKAVPREALRLNVGEFAISEINGDNAKSAPLTLKARSGKPIEHWFWGNIVHDLSGMKLSKPRVAVDYNHNADEVIGYLNKFDSSSGDLIASGALVPYKGEDRATEIIFKAKQGIPYEASIFFGGDGIVLEEVDAGRKAMVNGYEFEGPGVIVREWPLRGVAICPYGADMNTETKLADGGETVTVTYKEKEQAMGTEAEAAKLAAVEAEKKAKEEAELKAQQEAEAAKLAAVEAEKKAAEELAAKTPGKKYMDTFGEAKGALYFAKGLSFADAEIAFNLEIKQERDALVKENAELKARLAALSTSGADAASTSAPAPEATTGGAEEGFMDLAKAFASDKKVSMTKAMSEVAKINPKAFAKYRAGKSK